MIRSLTPSSWSFAEAATPRIPINGAIHSLAPSTRDLSAFPPTCVVVGKHRPSLRRGVHFADKLKKAGRDATLLAYEGMPHVFMLFPGIDEGERSIDEICAFLRSHLANRRPRPSIASRSR